MSRDSHPIGVDIVLHVAMMAGIVCIVGATFLFGIPDLFNLHSTIADMAALAWAGGTLAFAYIAGGYALRSMKIVTGHGEEK